MDRRSTLDDRRVAVNGRRAIDAPPAENPCVEMIRELSRLKTVLQTLVDAVQALTGSQTKHEQQHQREPIKKAPQEQA
jgi:hypothetical protein